jgi:hypothetical protein
VNAEPTRVGRFEWERLVTSSDLPRATQTVLVMLGIFMSADGGDARPGLAALQAVTGRRRSVLSEHLRAAINAGYLIERERGGFRRTVSRASEYQAAVPAAVYERRAEILGGPPWRRQRDTPTSGFPDVGSFDEGPENRALVGHERPVSLDQGPVLGHERPENRTPPRTYTTHPHHPDATAVESRPNPGEGGAQPEGQKRSGDEPTITAVQALRGDWTVRSILGALAKAERDGRDPAHCREALIRLARGDHGDTKSPGRLATDGPWWAAVAKPAEKTPARCSKHPAAIASRCTRCLDAQPRCKHGTPAGLVLLPSGKPSCPHCRWELRQQGAAA